MRYHILIFVIGISCLIASRILMHTPVQADGPTVVFNELMWMGSSLSSADEWIELRNTTDQPIDLSNWQITKKSNGVETAMVTIPSGKILPPSGFFVISNYSSGSMNSALNSIADVVTTDVALSNSALQVRLYTAQQQLMDVADDGVGNPFAGSFDSGKKMYASMERNPIFGDGATITSWHTASRAVGFKPGAIELGTPGAQNSNGLPIAHAGADQKSLVGQSINFDGSESVDPEQQTLTYAWDFGDGGTSSEGTPSHSYAAAGVYTVTLIVNDGVDSASDIVTVTVTPTPAAAITPTPPSITPVGSENDNALTATTSCLGLHISEVYPNPPGVDTEEFIELVNDSDDDIVSGSCSVFSSATRSFAIPAGTTITRGGYLSLPKAQTHLTLNNGGTTVRLVDSDGTELDRVTYGTSKEGWSWMRDGAVWLWTTRPTAGAKNIALVPAVSPAAKKTATAKTTKTTSSKKDEVPAQTVTIHDVQELDSGDRVIVEGVVIAPRDTLGSTIAYIQSEDGGISIAIPNGESTIQSGQKIHVMGTVRLKNGRRYVSVAAKGVQIISSGSVPTAPMLPTDDVGIEQADQLVHVRGVVALASGSTVQIDDGSGPLNVYIKSSTGIIRPKIKAGDTVDVVGLVGVSTSGIRVLPRTQEDLRVEKVLGVSTSVPTQVVTPPAASKTQTLWYWSLVVFGAMITGVKPLWKKIHEKKKP